MKIRFLVLSVLCLMLAACATGPVYRPAQQPSDYGYRDTMLTSDQFRVSFAGSDDVARETVENFAMFRAAQVALSHGSSYFRVVSHQTSPITSYDNYGPTASFGYGFGFPYWGTGFGYGFGGQSEVRYQSVLMIQIGNDLPTQNPDVYNAEQIKQNLAPVVAADQR